MAGIRCPQCGSEAFNFYGRTKNGKQRYICLVCSRQFVDGEGNMIEQRPNCPLCSQPMHIYMRDHSAIRFRCSRYPGCRGYSKIAKEN